MDRKRNHAKGVRFLFFIKKSIVRNVKLCMKLKEKS